MMNALRMRMETRRTNKNCEKVLRKEAKKETKILIECCCSQARIGKYKFAEPQKYSSSAKRNRVAYLLRNKGYKVETTNRNDGVYEISSISWIK